jgi:hypothetical protein
MWGRGDRHGCPGRTARMGCRCARHLVGASHDAARDRSGGRSEARRYPTVRPAGAHCFQWYAGDLFRRFEEDAGIYFLTDWLVTNWERAVVKGLGLDRFPTLKDTYFGNIARVLFVRQHPDPARETKAREIAAWMDRPLEIHDLGIAPLEDLLTPLVEGPDQPVSA